MWSLRKPRIGIADVVTLHLMRGNRICREKTYTDAVRFAHHILYNKLLNLPDLAPSTRAPGNSFSQICSVSRFRVPAYRTGGPWQRNFPKSQPCRFKGQQSADQ